MNVYINTKDLSSDHLIDSVVNAKAKALHLINGEHFSGAERVQDLLALALPQFGYEVGFACIKPGKFPEARQSDVPLFDTPMKSKFDFRCVDDVIDAASWGSYSILHAHTPRTLMIGSRAAKKLKCPLVYHVHSPVGRDSSRGLMNRINSFVEKLSLRRVDRMICVSNSLAGYMQQTGHRQEKLSVVLNGVPTNENLPQRQPPSEPWTIGTMALFRPRKGTEVLLEAVKILLERGVKLNLRAVGPFETPAYQSEVMALAEQLGIADRIEWPGFQSDVNAQFAQMDVFVLPSLYGEGLPMVVLESMANGVPVVAANVEGIPEAIRDDVDGLIFEPGNAEQLADKLASLIGDRSTWQRMSDSSLNRQCSELSDRSMAQGVAAVYDQLLS